VRLQWTRSATRHRISRDRSRYVIEHCGLVGEEPPPLSAPANAPDRLVYLGDDQEGVALEVLGVQLADGVLLVIHAMPRRDKYMQQYEEAKKWRK